MHWYCSHFKYRHVTVTWILFRVCVCVFSNQRLWLVMISCLTNSVLNNICNWVLSYRVLCWNNVLLITTKSRHLLPLGGCCFRGSSPTAAQPLVCPDSGSEHEHGMGRACLLQLAFVGHLYSRQLNASPSQNTQVPDLANGQTSLCNCNRAHKWKADRISKLHNFPREQRAVLRNSEVAFE
jgi:hypothetical protein